MVRHLKIWTEYFDAVASGKKTVELRNDDRGFAVGDTLILREWQPSTEDIMNTMEGKSADGTTGRECRVVVTHITRGEAWLQPGIVALSIRAQASADRLAALERVAALAAELRAVDGMSGTGPKRLALYRALAKLERMEADTK